MTLALFERAQFLWEKGDRSLVLRENSISINGWIKVPLFYHQTLMRFFMATQNYRLHLKRERVFNAYTEVLKNYTTPLNFAPIPNGYGPITMLSFEDAITRKLSATLPIKGPHLFHYALHSSKMESKFQTLNNECDKYGRRKLYSLANVPNEQRRNRLRSRRH